MRESSVDSGFVALLGLATAIVVDQSSTAAEGVKLTVHQKRLYWMATFFHSLDPSPLLGIAAA